MTSFPPPGILRDLHPCLNVCRQKVLTLIDHFVHTYSFVISTGHNPMWLVDGHLDGLVSHFCAPFLFLCVVECWKCKKKSLKSILTTFAAGKSENIYSNWLMTQKVQWLKKLVTKHIRGYFDMFYLSTKRLVYMLKCRSTFRLWYLRNG